MFARAILLVAVFWLMVLPSSVWSAPKKAKEVGPPKIAVTDLTYEDKVMEYFRNVDIHHDAKSDKGRGGERSSSLSYASDEGTRILIDRGELHKYTADIKGELIKAGYTLIQGRPFAMKDREKIFDIIARIKNGDYKGADYVLFGTVSSVDFREETTPVPGSQTLSHSLTLELVVDFSLINTKTNVISASFNATGEGSDVRLQQSAPAKISLSRGRVMAETSKSIAQEVIRQLAEQVVIPGGGRGEYDQNQNSRQPYRGDESTQEPVMIYR